MSLDRAPSGRDLRNDPNALVVLPMDAVALEYEVDSGLPAVTGVESRSLCRLQRSPKSRV